MLVRSIPLSFGMYKENLHERMIHADWDFCVCKVFVRNPRKSSYMRPQGPNWGPNRALSDSYSVTTEELLINRPGDYCICY